MKEDTLMLRCVKMEYLINSPFLYLNENNLVKVLYLLQV